MQTKKIPIQPQLSNAIHSLFNRLLLIFFVCLTVPTQAASGTRITQEAYRHYTLKL